MAESNAAGPATPTLLDTMIADFEAALAEPSGRCRGICIACGVDHDNEQRLNRSVISLTLRRLRRLRDESVSSGPATPTPEGRLLERIRLALTLWKGPHPLVDLLQDVERTLASGPAVSPQLPRPKFPPVQLQDGKAPEWTCQECGADALFCGCKPAAVSLQPEPPESDWLCDPPTWQVNADVWLDLYGGWRFADLLIGEAFKGAKDLVRAAVVILSTASQPSAVPQEDGKYRCPRCGSFRHHTKLSPSSYTASANTPRWQCENCSFLFFEETPPAVHVQGALTTLPRYTMFLREHHGHADDPLWAQASLVEEQHPEGQWVKFADLNGALRREPPAVNIEEK